MLAPRGGGLAGRVARCDDDDDGECPERHPILNELLPIAASTLFLGAVAAVGEWIKDRGETRRERMRQDGKDRRAARKREDTK